MVLVCQKAPSESANGLVRVQAAHGARRPLGELCFTWNRAQRADSRRLRQRPGHLWKRPGQEPGLVPVRLMLVGASPAVVRFVTAHRLKHGGHAGISENSVSVRSVRGLAPMRRHGPLHGPNPRIARTLMNGGGETDRQARPQRRQARFRPAGGPQSKPHPPAAPPDPGLGRRLWTAPRWLGLALGPILAQSMPLVGRAPSAGAPLKSR